MDAAKGVLLMVIDEFAEPTEAEAEEWKKQYAAKLARLAAAFDKAMAGERVQLTKGTTVSGRNDDLRNLKDAGVIIGWVNENDYLIPDSFSSDKESFVDTMYSYGIDVA
jgi:hypothetical protein